MELHKTDFPPQSLGYQIFPAVLEGRVRPIPIFEHPVNLLVRLTATQERALSGLGISSLSDMMGFPFTQFRQIDQRGLVSYKLAEYLKGDLAIGPRGYLLEVVFEHTHLPIPVEFESAQEVAVTATLATLQDNERRILDLHFGLTTGIRLTTEQTAREANITRQRVRDIETTAFRKLRHRSNSAVLSLYAPLPATSLGTTVFDRDFGIEINEQIKPHTLETLRVRDLNFAPYILEEFPSLRTGWESTSNLPLSLLVRLDENEFPEPVAREIKQTLTSLKS